MKVSTHETFVNVPVSLYIAIVNAEQHSRPALPEIEGVTILGPRGPQRNSNMYRINGKVTRKVTLTYTFTITPHQIGRFEIPEIVIKADGKKYHTEPHVILVTESETSDLLFVELYADKESVYVGDSLTVKLQIWLRPFRDLRLQLDERGMWRTVDQNNSSWGPFAEILADRNSNVSVRSAIRTDSEGDERAYFVYELKKTIWADKAGQFDPGRISILVKYPTEVGRVRDPFDFGFFSSRRVGVTKTKSLVQKPLVGPIEVKAIPVEGQPEHFSGAVGQYSLNVTAKPTAVAVGDPITLSLTIRGDGRLETLQPPPLLEWTELTQAFRIPTDPMAGVVKGRRKRFTQSIRPKTDAVAEIPAIPFSYFDPRTEKFVTVYSEAIPITVRPADTMSVADVVEAGGRAPVNTELRELSGGILANYTGMDEVLTHQAFAPGWRSAAAVSVPPVLFFACLVMHRQRDRLRRDPRYARRRSAGRRALKKIDEARKYVGTEAADWLAATLTDYVADCCGLPTGGLTRADARNELERRNVPADAVAQVDHLLETCEDLKFAGLDSSAGQDLAVRATECVKRLEREKL